MDGLNLGTGGDKAFTLNAQGAITAAGATADEVANAANGAANAAKDSEAAVMNPFMGELENDGMLGAERFATIGSNSLVINITTFSNNPGFPTLPNSDGTPQDAQAGLEMLFDVATWLGTLDSPPPPGSAADAAQSIDNVVTEEASIPPEVAAAAQSLGLSAAQYVAAKTQASNDTQQLLMGMLLSGQISEDQLPQLLFALNDPSSSNLPPNSPLGQLVQQINTQVNQSIAQELGIPNWPGAPPNPQEFKQAISQQFDKGFEEQVAVAVLTGQITPEEGQELLTAHFSGNSPANLPPHLQTLYQQMTTTTVEQLQAQYGADAGWVPDPEISYFNNVTNGYYAQTAQSMVSKYYGNITDPAQQAYVEQLIDNPNASPPPTPPANLTPAQVAQLQQSAVNIEQTRMQMLQYMENPNDPTIPPDAKAAAQNIIQQATAATVKEFGLESTWAPSTTAVSAVMSPQVTAAQNNLNTLNTMYQSAGNIVNAMPPGPTKDVYLNFLKAIGLALNQLQQTLYSIESSNSQEAQKVAGAKCADQLASLEKQIKTDEEANKKAGKMASSGPLGQIMTWMTNICMMAACCLLPPPLDAIALAATVAYIAMNTAGKGGLITKGFQEMNKGITEICNKMGFPPQLTQALCAIADYEVAIVLSCGNPMLAVSLLTQNSGAVQNAVEACGGSAQQAQIANAAVGMIANVVIMVALMFVTGGASTPELAEYCVTAAAKLGVTITKAAAQSMITYAGLAAQITMTSMSIAESGIQLNNNILMAQITLIKGKMQEFITEIEGLIQVLTQLMTKLMDSLPSLGDWTQSISQFQANKWNQADAKGTAINNALQG